MGERKASIATQYVGWTVEVSVFISWQGIRFFSSPKGPYWLWGHPSHFNPKEKALVPAG
jgi:hypothetical protein